MAYSCQKNHFMPHERSLLMPFSVRRFAEDDKLCHHMTLEVLQDLFPRLTVGGVLRRLASGARFLWPDPSAPVASDGAICQRRQQLGVTPVRQLFRRWCRPQATPQTKGAFRWGRRVVAMDGTCEDVAETPANANYFGRISDGPSKSPFPQLRALY